MMSFERRTGVLGCMATLLMTVSGGGCSSSSEDGSQDPATGTGGAAGGSPGSGGGATESGGRPAAGGEVSPGAGGRPPCVDTDTNPLHCGACDLACPALVLAEGQRSPDRILVDDTSVYWETVSEGSLSGSPTGAIRRMPLAGGPPVTLVSNVDVSSDMRIDATHLYWSEPDWSEAGGGLIRRVPLAGGAPATVVATTDEMSGRFVVGAGSLYWVRGGTVCPLNDDCVTAMDIMKTATSGGASTVVVSTSRSVGAIAVDATSLYWSSAGNLASDYRDSVMKVAIDGGEPVTLALGENDVTSLAVSATDVFWTSSSPFRTLMKVPLGGGAPTVLAGGSTGSEVTVRGAHVYWLEGTETVKRMPITGGGSTTLASWIYPGHFAVGESTVYWTQSGFVKALGGTSCVGGLCSCPEGQVACFGTCIDIGDACD